MFQLVLLHVFSEAWLSIVKFRLACLVRQVLLKVPDQLKECCSRITKTHSVLSIDVVIVYLCSSEINSVMVISFSLLQK